MSKKLLFFATATATAVAGIRLAELSAHYPNVPVSALPKDMQIHRLLDEELAATNRFSRDRKPYIAYCDSFTVRLPLAIQKTAAFERGDGDEAAIEEILCKFLTAGWARLEADIWGSGRETLPDARHCTLSEGSSLGGMMVVTAHKPGSVLARWQVSQGPISFFDRIARYGYPWRLMNGGFNEIFVEKLPGTSGTVRLWFVSAHDYTAEGTGREKIIPGFVQRLHRIFARAVLRSGAKAVEQ